MDWVTISVLGVAGTAVAIFGLLLLDRRAYQRGESETKQKAAEATLEDLHEIRSIDDGLLDDEYVKQLRERTTRD